MSRRELDPLSVAEMPAFVIFLLGFITCLLIQWFFVLTSESLSPVLWGALVAPVVFATLLLHSTLGRQYRIGLTAAMLGLAAFLCAVGVTNVEGWGSDRWPDGIAGLVAGLVAFAAVATPITWGATRIQPHLMIAIAAVLLVQALVAVLSLALPEPQLAIDRGIVAMDRILILAAGGAGALFLIGSGTLLRRHIPLWFTWPAAITFFLMAAIYQGWYPPMSDFGR